VVAEHPTDEDLVGKYYGCSDQCLRELYRRYEHRLTTFFKSGIGQIDADDLAQEVFVRLMNTKYPNAGRQANPYSSSGGAAFRTWLYKIAHNLLIDFARKSGRNVDMAEQAGDGDDLSASNEIVLVALDPSPTDILLAKEARNSVHSAMARLPHRERIAILTWLQTEDDFRLETLGEILKVSVPTAHRVLKSAFNLMRQSLEELSNEQQRAAAGDGKDSSL
jgi:RNA polymerase sigma-70 factor (ECF subfamily)